MWTVSRAGTPDPRRFADRYASALDRLADARAHLRVGALHTLEALAAEFPDQAQAVVDVICAYLRSPVGDDGPVRQTAQAMLAQHLRPGPQFWPRARLDLTGATLVDLDLSACRIGGGLVLDRASLLGSSRLRATNVGGGASLRGVTWHEHAWLERSVFHGPARFDASSFAADAWFGEARFGGPVSFAGASFAGHAWFGGCAFAGPVDFTEAVFRRSAGFRGAMLRGGAELAGTTFLGPARVSRQDEAWNVQAPGWGAVVDPDNEAVGQLLWLGTGALVESTPV